MRQRGYSGFKMHYIGGQYMVLDELTQRMYDIETYAGVPANKREQLAIDERMRTGSPYQDSRWAARWLQQRAVSAANFFAQFEHCAVKHKVAGNCLLAQ